MQTDDVIVVGAGQAGLALSWNLTRLGVRHAILERGEIGHAWREDRWDSFCLVTPNWTITLPGAEYAGDDPEGFMPRDAFVRRLVDWAATFRAPVETHVEVRSLRGDGDGYVLETTRGPRRARQVALATATYQRPRTPDLATAIAPDIHQAHAARYRTPSALPPGGVLVVGSGQSGCQIAEELAAAGRETFLAVGAAGRLPRRYRGRDCIAWQRDMGLLDRTADMLADPALRFRGDPHLTGAGGGRTLSLHTLAANGVTLLGRVAGVEAGGGALRLHDDLAANVAAADAFAAEFRRSVDAHVAAAGVDAPMATTAEMAGEPTPGASPPVSPARIDLVGRGVATIVWATGFQFDFRWIEPAVFDRFGYPDNVDGGTVAPGLYFMGLNWLPKRKSGIIYGVAEDAERLAGRIAAAA